MQIHLRSSAQPCLPEQHPQPYSEGGSEHILFQGGAILHTHTNFWTAGDTELKFYMVIDIYKLFPKIVKKLGWKC